MRSGRMTPESNAAAILFSSPHTPLSASSIAVLTVSPRPALRSRLAAGETVELAMLAAERTAGVAERRGEGGWTFAAETSSGAVSADGMVALELSTVHS